MDYKGILEVQIMNYKIIDKKLTQLLNSYCKTIETIKKQKSVKQKFQSLKDLTLTMHLDVHQLEKTLKEQKSIFSFAKEVL